ncbi:MAG TPA: hypothetical protein VEV20_02015 [Burkholderiales bacterium]|nr:hypothetical protein [Burkholderiales bacterium]
MSRLAGQDFDSGLLQSFGVKRQSDWPVAPFTWLADGGDPARRYWLRADPIHLRAERDVLVLVDVLHIGLDRQSADKFIATLNAHFESDDLVFHAPVAERWYVGLPDAPGIATHPLSVAAGRSVSPLLPSGTDALAWHRRFNEIQMLFHEHPVNMERETAGQPTINSVWFWGGGTLSSVDRAFAGVSAENPLARGLATAARIPWASLPGDGTEWLSQTDDGAHVVMLDTQTTGEAALPFYEERWFLPLLQALKERRLATVRLLAMSGDDLLRYDVAARDLWKFWRRTPAQVH